MMRDLHNNIKAVNAIAPQNQAGNVAVVSSIIDRQGFESLEFVILTGSLADVDATFTVLVEHGDTSNLADAAAVDDSDLLGTEADASFTFDDDNSVKKIGYTGEKRYVRLTITPANNAGDAYLAAVAILGHAFSAPVS